MIRIRELRAADSVEAITDLLHAAYAPLAAMNFRYTASYQDSSITSRRLRNGFPFVAAEGSELIGTITLYGSSADSPCAWYQQEGVFHFGQFAVLPSPQGRGIGRLLLEKVEEAARERNARELALDTAEGAVHLLNWYERCGFRFVQYVSWTDTNYRSVVLSKRLLAASPSLRPQP